MHLTTHTDFALRTLIYLAAHPDDQATTQEIALAYGISVHHLLKVVHDLGHHGFLEISRGRSGGIALSRSPSEIRVGDVVRKLEPTFDIAECFDPATNQCPITRICGLKSMLSEASTAFLESLDSYTLDDITGGNRARGLKKVLGRVGEL